MTRAEWENFDLKTCGLVWYGYKDWLSVKYFGKLCTHRASLAGGHPWCVGWEIAFLWKYLLAISTPSHPHSKAISTPCRLGFPIFPVYSSPGKSILSSPGTGNSREFREFSEKAKYLKKNNKKHAKIGLPHPIFQLYLYCRINCSDKPTNHSIWWSFYCRINCPDISVAPTQGGVRGTCNMHIDIGMRCIINATWCMMPLFSWLVFGNR